MKDHRGKARVISYLLIALVLAHTAVIALWAGPKNPIKDAIGPSKIRSYVNPVFEQDWHIFAPTPKRVTSEMDFRAQVLDEETGDISVTPWYALVEGENEMIRHNPSPPRTAFAARRTSLPLHNVANSMNEDQRAIIEENFAGAEPHVLAQALQKVPTDSGASNSEVNKYLKYDQMATALAAMTGGVLYEGRVVAVQVRTAKAAVPDFAERRFRTLADVTRTKIDYGWRLAPEVSAQELELFAPYATRVPLASEGQQ